MPLFGFAGIFDNGTAAAVPTLGGWVSAQTMCATNATSTAYYNALSQTAATTANSAVYWVQEQNVTPSQYMALAQNRAVYCRERTAQEIREQAERQRIMNEEYERRVAAGRLAKERSRELLLSHLTKEQRRTFEKNLWFVVEGGRTRQRYRIHDGSYSGNIHVLQGERVTHRLCCHCADGVPIYDHLLAQKLHLQYDEDAFLRMANRHAA